MCNIFELLHWAYMSLGQWMAWVLSFLMDILHCCWVSIAASQVATDPCCLVRTRCYLEATANVLFCISQLCSLLVLKTHQNLLRIKCVLRTLFEKWHLITTVKPPFMGTHLIWTPLYCRQLDLSLHKKGLIFSLNSTLLIWTPS